MDIVRVPRTDPAYNSHSYLTKVPEGAIRPFLDAYTKPGDTVVDPFAGSGMTGVAAYVTGRNAILSDISELGRHIGSNLVNFVIGADYLAAADSCVQAATAKIDGLYLTECNSCSKATYFGKFVWSFVYECASCKSPLVYYELVRDNKWRPPTECPHCQAQFLRRTAKRIDEVPVLVHYTCEHCGEKGERAPLPADYALIDKAALHEDLDTVPSLEIESNREMYRRSALGKNGHTTTKSFFSPRNALALSQLHRQISSVKDPLIRSKLLFAFTAILPRASKRYQWHFKRPLNAQNQTYYIAPVFYEWNVFDLFKRKIRAALRSDEYIQKLAKVSSSTDVRIEYVTSSADSLTHIPDRSVDYVFTDPPFGSNMFYSDMSLFQEAWLGHKTDPTREAVIQTSRQAQSDAAARYEEVLSGTLKECWRILKPGSRMSIVFSNSRGEVWAMLQRAIQDSGFDYEPDAITLLDKGQRSVKGLASGKEGVVTVDLVLTLVRRAKRSRRTAQKKDIEVRDMIAALMKESFADSITTPSHVYLHVIRKAVELHLSLESLHLSDVLVALHSLGYSVDQKSGRLEITAEG